MTFSPAFHIFVAGTGDDSSAPQASAEAFTALQQQVQSYLEQEQRQMSDRIAFVPHNYPQQHCVALAPVNNHTNRAFIEEQEREYEEKRQRALKDRDALLAAISKQQDEHERLNEDSGAESDDGGSKDSEEEEDEEEQVICTDESVRQSPEDDAPIEGAEAPQQAQQPTDDAAEQLVFAFQEDEDPQDSQADDVLLPSDNDTEEGEEPSLPLQMPLHVPPQDSRQAEEAMFRLSPSKRTIVVPARGRKGSSKVSARARGPPLPELGHLPMDAPSEAPAARYSASMPIQVPPVEEGALDLRKRAKRAFAQQAHDRAPLAARHAAAQLPDAPLSQSFAVPCSLSVRGLFAQH